MCVYTYRKEQSQLLHPVYWNSFARVRGALLCLDFL